MWYKFNFSLNWLFFGEFYWVVKKLFNQFTKESEEYVLRRRSTIFSGLYFCSNHNIIPSRLAKILFSLGYFEAEFAVELLPWSMTSRYSEDKSWFSLGKKFGMSALSEIFSLHLIKLSLGFFTDFSYTSGQWNVSIQFLLNNYIWKFFQETTIQKFFQSWKVRLCIIWSTGMKACESVILWWNWFNSEVLDKRL